MSNRAPRLRQRLPLSWRAVPLACLLVGFSTSVPWPGLSGSGLAVRGAMVAALSSIGIMAAGAPRSAPSLGDASSALDEAAVFARGRLALRAMDCARCHGRDLDGWAATSLIAAVCDGSRERFTTYVLDGDIGRGMPGYRGQPVVVDNLDAIYDYLVARATGPLAAEGKPAP